MTWFLLNNLLTLPIFSSRQYKGLFFKGIYFFFLTLEGNIMNTQKILMPVLATLVDNGVPVNDNLTNAIYTALIGLSENKLTEETRKMLPTLRGGAMFDSISDDVVIHIPTFYKATKAEKTSIKVEKHSVTIPLPSYDVETVRFFSIAMGELINRQPDYSVEWNNEAKLTALVDFVIPVLQGQPITQLVKSTSVTLTAAQLSNVGVNNLSLLATDDYGGIMATTYKHPKHGQCYKLTYNYQHDSNTATKILSKLMQGGFFRDKSMDKDNRLIVYLSSSMLDLSDDDEIEV